MAEGVWCGRSAGHDRDASYPAMVEAADAMVKAAKVELVAYEKTGGGHT